MSRHCDVVARGPDTLFAKRDGVHVAYQVIGHGDLDILVFSSGLLPVDSMDEEPSLARFHRRLASIGRLIRFDLRGIGLSDPISPAQPPSLEQWVDDAVAVLDAAHSERAAVFAPRDSSLPAILLAATFPDRVASLVMVNGTARVARADDYAIGIPGHVLDRFLDENTAIESDEESSFDFLSSAAPTVADDESFRAWWIKAGYRGASPSTARALQAVTLGADVRPILAAVQAPTLVMHRRSDIFVRVAHGRYLADHIRDATFVELDGADDLYWVGDTEGMLDEIEEFLTGVRHGPGADRMLATILFTDIVGSTERAVAEGDMHWRDLLDQHDAALRRQLVRFGGREVKTTGDGVLAVFDGPTRAVTCATAIRDAAPQIGLSGRVGIHTGEVTTRGDDVSGVAVHIAARVEAKAEPDEVLVSRTVADLVVGSGLTFADRGEHTLKGVPGTWRLLSVG